MTMQPLRIFSFGGGVQSMAALVLAKRGTLRYDHFVFSNVGADSENPETLEYLHKYAMPFAADFDIDLVELFRRRRNGEIETLYSRIMGTQKSVPIPVYLKSGAPGNRTCTVDFKIRVIDRWCKKQGSKQTVVGLGISIDEFQRARTTEWELTDYKTERKREYPLIDLRLSRQACANLIQSEGLPVPPKSSCYFCPFHSQGAWLRLRQERPDLFAKAVGIDERIGEKRREMGKDIVFLHRSMRPLGAAVGEQLMLPDAEDSCESGYCMT